MDPDQGKEVDPGVSGSATLLLRCDCHSITSRFPHNPRSVTAAAWVRLAGLVYLFLKVEFKRQTLLVPFKVGNQAVFFRGTFPGFRGTFPGKFSGSFGGSRILGA